MVTAWRKTGASDWAFMVSYWPMITVCHGVVGDEAGGPVVAAHLLDALHLLEADEIVEAEVG